MRIKFEGGSNFELRVCLSLITMKEIEIDGINVDQAGLRPEQVSLLELFGKLSCGANISINKTGCRVTIKPGTLIGGKIDHECSHEAALGYYAMYLILLAPFCRSPTSVSLIGVTNKFDSMSPETLTYGLEDIIKEMVGPASIFSLEVKRRGTYPDGGGFVIFTARPVNALLPLNRTKVGKIQKVKGLSWTTRVNVTAGKRTIDGAKKSFVNLLSDVFIRLDHSNRERSGNSPGYGIILAALTTEGITYTTEITCKSIEESNGDIPIPENIGKEAAQNLKNAMARGGITSIELDPIVLTMMALGQRHVSKALFGAPNKDTCQLFRDILLFTGVKYNVVPLRPGMELFREKTGQELLLTCMGCGLVNLNKAIR